MSLTTEQQMAIVNHKARIDDYRKHIKLHRSLGMSLTQHIRCGREESELDSNLSEEVIGILELVQKQMEAQIA